MRASIVIAAHQEGHLLGKTVESCLRVTSDIEREIIVADDASTDDSVALVAARFPEVQVVRHKERLGPAPTKHLGARRATGDVFVFLDAHTNPEPGSILRLVENVELLDGAAILTPAIANLCPRTWRNVATGTGHGYSLELETFNSGWLALDKLRKVERAGRSFYESPAAIGCALAVARELYDRLWGFDAAMRLWGVEDLDFSLKCWLMGHTILHDPEAVIGHRFQEKFSTYQVSAEQILASQLRMAYKNLSPTTWRQWLRACRHRLAEAQSDRPEGMFASAWHQFELDYTSAELERAYLSARRSHDDFWYAERFDLTWPRMAAVSRASLPLTLHPFADPSPTPSPSCSGVITISINGSDPANTGPVFICFETSISLIATMSGGPFPAGKPVWSFVKQPAGSAIGPPAAGMNPVAITPDVEGEYIIQAACDNITATFRFIADTVTLSEYGFSGDGKTTLMSNNGTYGDESGDPVPVPEYKPSQNPSPVSYVQGSTISIEATFTITPDLGADEFSFRIGGFARLLKDGLTFDYDDTITLSGTSVTHVFTLTPELPLAVLNDQLELSWSICEDVEVTHAIYVTYGPPSDGVVTVTRIGRVTSACNGLADEDEIVNTLWTKVAGPGRYRLGAPYPTPIWKILDGVPGECIAIANLFVATIQMVGADVGDGQVVYCYVDPNGGSHESTSTTAFATRGCAIGQNGHDAAHGATHGNQNNMEKLIWVDGKGGLNNWEACYKYRSNPSGPYRYYAAGTGGDPPWPSVQAVMNAYARSTRWQYVDANFGTLGDCSDPGPLPERNPY